MNVRTSIEIPDEMYRSLKIHAATRGVTFKDVILEGAQRVLNSPDPQPDETWREYFGICAHLTDELDRVQKLIDEEFEPVDPEEWK